MEGFYFYWISWCAWIVTTFILDKKNAFRLPLAIVLLVSISLSMYMVEIGPIEVSLTGLFLLSVCYTSFITVHQGNLSNLVFRILTLTIFTTAFYLYALYDPFWVVVDLGLIQSVIFTCLALFLFRDFIIRMTATTAGLIQGDALYSLILHDFYLDHPVASLLFLDRLALTQLAITGWTGLLYVRHLFQKNISWKKEKPM